MYSKFYKIFYKTIGIILQIRRKKDILKAYLDNIKWINISFIENVIYHQIGTILFYSKIGKHNRN